MGFIENTARRHRRGGFVCGYDVLGATLAQLRGWEEKQKKTARRHKERTLATQTGWENGGRETLGGDVYTMMLGISQAFTSLLQLPARFTRSASMGT